MVCFRLETFVVILHFSTVDDPPNIVSMRTVCLHQGINDDLKDLLKLLHDQANVAV